MPEPSQDNILLSDEKSNYEALLKIKELPEGMASKRRRKATLGTVQRRFKGWRRIKWTMGKAWANIQHRWRHDFSNIRLFQGSLQKIEISCGTAILNVFLFVRWCLLLNLVIAILSLFIVIIPYFVTNRDVVSGDTHPGQECGIRHLAELLKRSDTIGWEDKNDRMACCSKKYSLQTTGHHDLEYVHQRGTITELIQAHIPGVSTIEESLFFYGYYVNMHPDEGHDLFAVGYVFHISLSLLISLILMVRSVGRGIKEMIMSTVEDHTPYADLIFGGWDHCTKDAKSVLFKRQMLVQQMRGTLADEHKKLEKGVRSKREQAMLVVMRILVNLVVVTLLVGASCAIFYTSDWSLTWRIHNHVDLGADASKEERKDAKQKMATRNFFIGFVPSLLISVLNILFPLVLAKIGELEKYSTHTASTLVLYRSLIIRLMSILVASISAYQLKYCYLRDNLTCSSCHADASLETRVPCWESVFADQLYKLLMAEFVIKFFLAMIVQPIRVQLKKWFKHKLFQIMGTIQFSIVRHSLDIIYLQVICWLGMYFAPFIPILAVVYLFLIFYIKKFSLLHSCNTVPDTLRTMKTTTAFIGAKLLAFIAVVLTNVYVLGRMMPSRGCGPFRKYNSSWEAAIELVKTSPESADVYEFIVSPTVTLPVTIVLILIAFYKYSVAQANRKMVENLQHMLILEGHDKQYLFARLHALRRGSAEGASTAHLQRERGGTHLTLADLNQMLQQHYGVVPPTQDVQDDDAEVETEKEEEKQTATEKK